MKKLFFGFLTFLPLIVMAQIFTSKSTNIEFYSKALIEDIKAVNTSSASLFNTATGEIGIRIPNNAFVFRSQKMQEDFNDDYMQSNKYPHSTFSGKINEKIDLNKEGTYTCLASGKLNIHGVEKERTWEGKVTVKKSVIEVYTQFYVVIKDHKIKVPAIVGNDIADSVLVTVNLIYIPYQK